MFSKHTGLTDESTFHGHKEASQKKNLLSDNQNIRGDRNVDFQSVLSKQHDIHSDDSFVPATNEEVVEQEIEKNRD